MFRRFLTDVRGNYALLTVISMVPIMGALAIGIDYTELSRQCDATRNALDAAGIATARRIAEGATEQQSKDYAKDFFEANLANVNPADTTLTVLLPNNNFGGGTLKLSASVIYHPHFLPAAAMLIGKTSSSPTCATESEIRLKNTLEVALVLDNSGSMREYGKGTSQQRIDLLKSASKELVETLAKQAAMMKQVSEPVRFGLVPFSASVNVGPENDKKSWMDTTGISPIHHENFDWSTMTQTEANGNFLGDRFAKKVGDAWWKIGTGWGETEGQALTRFSLFQDMLVESDRERVSGSRHYVCYEKYNNGTCKDGGYEYDYTYETSRFASWQGCVEARPVPYNNNDATPTASDPATLFVPMFAPDEPKHLWRDLDHIDETLELDGESFGYSNNWWADWQNGTDAKARQRDARKYFRVKPYGSSNPGSGYGPSFSCTTEPITPLTDVTVDAGKLVITKAIDDMQPTGNTNVPEGTAWGWRVVSSTEPFTNGRDNNEKGNDKVVIVLTDGANTYGDVNYYSSDLAENRSTYAAYGYVGRKFAETESYTRLYKDTSSDVDKATYTPSNYQTALDEQMRKVCANAKGANVLLMTVALDLDENDTAEAKAISELKTCASDSRFRKGEDGNPAKLFWNATGATLSTVFKEIADELSNLRIVG
jgi:Flp pilus assembly protein TadG